MLQTSAKISILRASPFREVGLNSKNCYTSPAAGWTSMRQFLELNLTSQRDCVLKIDILISKKILKSSEC